MTVGNDTKEDLWVGTGVYLDLLLALVWGDRRWMVFDLSAVSCWCRMVDPDHLGAVEQ